MMGLKKIINEIKQESKDECEKIIQEAKTKASEIIKDAELEAKNIRKKAEKDADLESDKMKERAESEYKLELNRKKLEVRQEIIENVISEARNRIINMPIDEYFDVLSKMIKSASHPQSGEIIITRRDFERMNESFKKCINQHLLDVLPKLNDEGGFILNYGNTVEDFSLKSLFDEKYERLTDLANSILWE